MGRWVLLVFGILLMLPVLIGVAIGFGLGSSDGTWLAVGARIVVIVVGAMLLLAVSAWQSSQVKPNCVLTAVPSVPMWAK